MFFVSGGNSKIDNVESADVHCRGEGSGPCLPFFSVFFADILFYCLFSRVKFFDKQYFHYQIGESVLFLRLTSFVELFSAAEKIIMFSTETIGSSFPDLAHKPIAFTVMIFFSFKEIKFSTTIF